MVSGGFPENEIYAERRIAELAGVTPSAVRKWKIPLVVQGSAAPNNPNKVWIGAVLQSLVTRKSRKPNLNLEEERAKLAKEQTAKTKVDCGKSKIECQIKEIEV